MFRSIALVFMLIVTSAHASDRYQDNRSSAADLVRSLYNAINLHEYARAYDYFSTPPAKDFKAFLAGYEHTARVDVLTGEITGDGAAGSIFYNVPTAIKATDDKGVSKIFLGCYTIRAVNGAVQEPPSRPYQIEKGALKLGKADDFQVYALPKCGDALADTAESAPTLEDAKTLFIASQKGNCQKVEETRGGINEPAVHEIKYNYAGAASDEPEQVLKLYVFQCTLAAYNETQVYYLQDSTGLRPLSFSEPNMVIKHKAGDEEGKTLESMKVRGFTATTELVNSEYDPATKTITSFSKWRGIGDASSNGTWKFVEGQFVLDDYSVDPTYDEEMNSISVFSNGQVMLK